VRSNAAVDLPVQQRITDTDLINMINTILFVGTDTTSLTLVWTLLLLAKYPKWQSSLRSELFTIQHPTLAAVDITSETIEQENAIQDLWKEINALPLLDNICRESLRIMSPLPSTLRVATVDDVLPVSAPFIGADGKMHDCVTIRKGTIVHVPIEGLHLDKGVWGEDAWQFKYVRSGFSHFIL
jgi:cytochrome P450